MLQALQTKSVGITHPVFSPVTADFCSVFPCAVDMVQRACVSESEIKEDIF